VMARSVGPASEKPVKLTGASDAANVIKDQERIFHHGPGMTFRRPDTWQQSHFKDRNRRKIACAPRVGPYMSLRIGEHAVRFGRFARAFAVLDRKYWHIQASTKKEKGERPKAPPPL